MTAPIPQPLGRDDDHPSAPRLSALHESGVRSRGDWGAPPAVATPNEIVAEHRHDGVLRDQTASVRVSVESRASKTSPLH